ncbi:hypothetical protein [Sphingomonas ginkgonis]|nr:hypothetical protein [Sphingomonas ginkgonis]
MFEYGSGFFEQNDVALEDMRDVMSAAAIALAERMADDEVALEGEVQED